MVAAKSWFSHPTRGTMWIVTGKVDKRKVFKRVICFWYFSLSRTCWSSVWQTDTLCAQPTCRSLLCAHRRSIMLLSSFLIFTFSYFLAPLFLCYLPQVSAQKSGSRVSAYLWVCWLTRPQSSTVLDIPNTSIHCGVPNRVRKLRTRFFVGMVIVIIK